MCGLELRLSVDIGRMAVSLSRSPGPAFGRELDYQDMRILPLVLEVEVDIVPNPGSVAAEREVSTVADYSFAVACNLAHSQS